MTHFLIADTFTDSLARLTGDEQKAAKTTAFDLQLDPTSPGMQFHKLERAKDKSFWCVRVNSDLRLIVHRTKASLLLSPKCIAWRRDRTVPAEADPWKRKFDQLMSEGDAAPEGDGAAESSPGGTSVTPLPPSEAEFLAELERSVQFTFAKTYAETYPHEYTTRRACPLEWHARLIALIEKHGVAERFYREERNYLYFGERKYWHMGRPYSQRPEGWPNVINRTLEVGRYADQARARGYEGEELEKLVRRWEALLRKARGE